MGYGPGALAVWLAPAARNLPQLSPPRGSVVRLLR